MKMSSYGIICSYLFLLENKRQEKTMKTKYIWEKKTMKIVDK